MEKCTWLSLGNSQHLGYDLGKNDVCVAVVHPELVIQYLAPPVLHTISMRNTLNWKLPPVVRLAPCMIAHMQVCVGIGKHIVKCIE